MRALTTDSRVAEVCEPGSTKRVLEPIERISEVLFGLIMVLGFTGSFSVADAGHFGVRTMVVGALGCNLAWGLIDAIMYLMACLADKGRALALLRAVRKATDPTKAHGLIAAALPSALAPLLKPDELESLRERLSQFAEPQDGPRLRLRDGVGALAVFLLVFVSTLPVVFPFFFVGNAWWALRLSNLIAIGMLFGTGYMFGHRSGFHPWLTGISMVILGGVLVSLTIALGG